MSVKTLNNFIQFATAFNINLTVINLKKFKKLEDDTKCKMK